ncbi:hypothetical protein V7S43_004566 [Phytophthora oleae]|uniref:Uncharacterized protein n=1 Tax=Phytophthora oleae TaxID=2107226 RepID=A0ABD3FU20_9STRA
MFRSYGCSQFLATQTTLPPLTENDHDANSEPTAPTAVSERSPSPTRLRWLGCFAILFVVFLSAIFGIPYVAKKVSELHEFFHFDKFKENTAELHQKMLTLEKDYPIWRSRNQNVLKFMVNTLEVEKMYAGFSELLREVTEDEEANLLTQLKPIQVEMQKWQKDIEECRVCKLESTAVSTIRIMMSASGDVFAVINKPATTDNIEAQL